MLFISLTNPCLFNCRQIQSPSTFSIDFPTIHVGFIILVLAFISLLAYLNKDTASVTYTSSMAGENVNIFSGPQPSSPLTPMGVWDTSHHLTRSWWSGHFYVHKKHLTTQLPIWLGISVSPYRMCKKMPVALQRIRSLCKINKTLWDLD